MSQKRNRNPGNRSSERARLIGDADLLFADAKEAQARAGEAEEAADCKQRARIIPTHYEESENE